MKYSIIIPCWGQETLVGQTLDSVRVQEVHDWEAICTDDGGLDKTGEVLDAYVEKYCRNVKTYNVVDDGEIKRVVEGACYEDGGIIRVIHQKNGGMSSARNTAKLHSSGEWYINLDGDDVLSPWALELLDGCINQRPDADMFCGGFTRFENGRSPNWRTYSGKMRVITSSGEIRDDIIANAFQQMVFNKRVCGDLILEGPNWSEERWYTARCVARTYVAVISEDGFYGYRVHPGQFTQKGMTVDECLGYLDTTIKIVDLYLKSPRGVTSHTIRHMLVHWIEWQSRLMFRYKANDRKRVFNAWVNSLSVFPSSYATPWFRFVAFINARLPFLIVARLTCFLPDWLKRHGIHR